MKRLFLPLLGFLSLVLMCCNDNKESGTDSYDPNKPVTIDYFTPDTGRVAEKVIIIGNNFGNDKSVVTVLFTDNMEKENKAAVVGVIILRFIVWRHVRQKVSIRLRLR